MADGRKRPWAPKKQRSVAGSSAATAEDEGIELQTLRSSVDELQLERESLFSPIKSETVYNMMLPGEKERLAADLWAGKLKSSLSELRAANPHLEQLLTAAMTNSSPETARSIVASARHIDGILVDICRGQNMHKVPLLTAAMSVLGEMNAVHREYHDAVSAFHMGATCAEKWVRDFLKVARTLRPAPPWTPMPDVAVCVFDNLTMQVDFKSFSSEGEAGRREDMTNWFYTPVPQYLAPTLDAKQLCESQPQPPWCLHSSRSPAPPVPHTVKDGVFRRDLSLRKFARQFYLHDARLVSNRKERWVRFMRAARNAELLQRPAYTAEWTPHKVYMPPIWGALQSSYDDVELELRRMSGVPEGPGKPRGPLAEMQILFVAGDGLALMRLNHLLANKRDLYIDQTPLIIPIQGEPHAHTRACARAHSISMCAWISLNTEVPTLYPGEHPHGLFHVMHCEWRLYREFLMWCAQDQQYGVANKQVVDDPNVSVFNAHRFFFLDVVTRACAEYVNLIAKTPGAESLDDPTAFIAKAEANVSSTMVVLSLVISGIGGG
jgi:hypothetical protein